jgi:DNA end-binding protein Ku
MTLRKGCGARIDAADEEMPMASRPAWKGYLKLSLVTCAVELSSAISESEKISFRVINRKTGNQVRRQYVDAMTGKAVDEKDEVKGYEVRDDEFVLIEDDEIEAVQIESSHTLNLERFVRKSDIDKIYLDTPYYLMPADEVSQEAFAVIRQALADKKMAGLARIVLWRRERPVVVEPFERGMLLTTLRYDKTVRHPDEVLDGIGEPKLDEEMIDMAARIIDKRDAKFEPSKFEDKYEGALIELVRSKKAGRKPPKAKKTAEPKPSNVVNLFDALKKSLASDDDGKAEKPVPRRSSKKAAGKRRASGTARKNAPKSETSRKRKTA